MLRQVIVTILGNVDSGKSTIIDFIKKTSIVTSEPGKITQSIKAYPVSIDRIKTLSKNNLNIEKIKVPGLLFIDTPGHAAFINLRKRGGSLADIAILVIDILDGLKPQTLESIEILKENKTPFIIALNKIDLIPGWFSKKDLPLIKEIKTQQDYVIKNIEERLYQIVNKLYNLGFNAERFDRIEDFSKQIAIVPISAKLGEGLCELLITITGLAQKFLESNLKYDPEAQGEGTILEITEEKGLGKCFDAIIYKGKIKTNDTIVIGTLKEPLVTKIKAIFITNKSQLKSVKEACAAVGVKISPQNSEGIISGMPLKIANKNLEKIKIEIREQIEQVTFELDEDGIIIKADTLGALEGLITLLKEKNFKIKRASIGNISKKDFAEALSSSNILNHVILGFNINTPESNESIKIITNNVIYTLIEKFEEWLFEEKSRIEAKELKDITRPCKIKLLEGYIFRQSNPAVIGVDVLAGTLKPNTPLMKDGKHITEAKAIQHEGKSINEAKPPQSVAVSFPGVTINRQIAENDILYSDIKESEFLVYKKLKTYLKPDEIQVLKEIAEIHRKTNPTWGI